MKSKDEVKQTKVKKRFFNFRQWSDADRIKGYYNYIVSSVKNLTILQRHTATESFAEAQARLGLQEKDIEERKIALYRLSVFMCILSGLLFLYSIYQWVYGSWPGFVLTLALVLITLVFAFRYHFWFYQIQQGKLGCTFKEWYQHGLLGRKSS